jgi:hypothetical protein
MTPRHALAVLCAALAAAAFARPASADDAQAAAAAAAAQAVGGVASGGSVPGVSGGAIGGGAAGVGNGRPSSGGHFQRALSAPAIPISGGGGEAKKGKPGAKAGKPGAKTARAKRAQESKYKSRELVEGSEHSYRFDENGNPVGGAPKKKAVLKPAKKASSASDDKDDKPGACSTDEPCTVKNTDADAL